MSQCLVTWVKNQLKEKSSEALKNTAVSFELFTGDLNILDLPNQNDTNGTVISGMVAYAGVSLNGKFYPPEELAKGGDKRFPVILNHGDAGGLENVPESLLPSSYRLRLMNGEEIVLGHVDLFWSWQTLQLTYRAVIKDPFYKNPEILKHMTVSQGVMHLPFDELEKVCSTNQCFFVIEGTEYSEMSLVFNSGFSIATLSVEKLQKRHTYKQANQPKNNMSTKNSKENSKSSEADQRADGIVTDVGNCGEGMMNDVNTGKCIPVPKEGPEGPDGIQENTNSGEAEHENDTDKDKDKDKDKETSTEQETDADKDKDKDKKKEEDSAEKLLKDADDAITKSQEAMKNYQKFISNADESQEKIDERMKGKGPNADSKSHERAQDEYNKVLSASLKSQESLSKVVQMQMKNSAEAAKQKAVIPTKSQNKLSASIERSESSIVQWVNKMIKTPSDESIPWHKSYTLSNEYLRHAGLEQKFKVRNHGDILGSHEYVNYESFMKKLGHSTEAVNALMAGGADPNNFQRTFSELVLIDPEGAIVTPIEQFCETKMLNPGQKEAFFYDINRPRFAPTDEANLDAGGGGFALAPSTVTINASGGKTNAEGALGRIGFTDLEELPIDIIQKYNIGLAMEAAERRNFEVLTTAYNVDTVYDPLVDDVKPKGGGTKDGRWVRDDNTNATTGAPDTDATTDGPMVFANLLKAKSIIGVRGVNVENLKAYLPYPAIQQLVNDTNISTYTQRSKPEIITQGVVERLSGIDLIPTSALAIGADGGNTDVRRTVVFIPNAWAAFVIGRELQIDAERVARDQSIYLTASQKLAAFIKKVELTARISTKSAAFD